MSNSSLNKEEVIKEIEESGLQNIETIQQKTIVSVQQKDDSEVRRWQVEVEEAEELVDEEIDISGRTILITDEDWNLGESIAEELVSKGAKVILLSLDTSVKEFSIEEKNEMPLLEQILIQMVRC